MTQSRQDTIAGALSLGLGLCLLLWLIPHWVEPDPDLRLPVSLVPQVVALGFIVCGTIMLAKGIHAGRQNEQPEGGGFDQGELRGLAVMMVILIVGTLGFEVLHFLVVAPAIVAVSMWVFGPVRPVSLSLTAAIGPVVIWVLATQVLGRVLP
ncbi:MAG: tripartite tricarboxylate transporter TctB family protein [Pseudomonadota bacterium]